MWPCTLYPALVALLRPPPSEPPAQRSSLRVAPCTLYPAQRSCLRVARAHSGSRCLLLWDHPLAACHVCPALRGHAHHAQSLPAAPADRAGRLAPRSAEIRPRSSRYANGRVLGRGGARAPAVGGARPSAPLFLLSRLPRSRTHASPHSYHITHSRTHSPTHALIHLPNQPTHPLTSSTRASPHLLGRLPPLRVPTPPSYPLPFSPSPHSKMRAFDSR